MIAKNNSNFLIFSICILLFGLLSVCSKDEIEVQIDDITLDVNELIIIIGDSKTIQYAISPANVNVNPIWSSDNTLIATVDDYGEVTGVKVGETNIKATVGDKTVSCKVKIIEKPVPVESISLHEREKNTSENFTLVATIYPENASNKTIIWTSNNEKVATVNQEGAVTIIAPGETLIIATTEDGGKQASCKVIVPPANVTGVTLNVKSLYLSLNETATIQATVQPENASNKNVTWFSDNTNVVIVDNTGKVTAVGKGNATITVKTEDGEMTASCKVLVSLAIFSDDFNRDNTGPHGPDNPKGIGANWTIIDGAHEIKEDSLRSRRGGDGSPNQAVIIYTAENAITNNFRISTDIKHGTWAGLIFNANKNGSTYSYYLFRVNPSSKTIQFLATENNGAGWTVLQTTAIQAANFPAYETYRMTIQSIEIGKFTAIITNSSGEKIGEYQLTDNKAKNFKDGSGGYWSQLDPVFDNFLLEVN